MADFAKLVARTGMGGALNGAAQSARGGIMSKAPLLALAVALLLSVGALWQAIDAAGRLAVAEQELSQLRQRVAVSPSPAGDESLRAQVHELGARVSDLAVIIEGPLSHLRQSNETSLEALTQRLVALEQKVATRSETASSATAAASQGEVSLAAASSSAGGWVINLISLSSEKDAQEQMLRLRQAGVRVEMQQAEHNGKSWYRLRVPGFSNYEGARAYIETVEKQTGVQNAWVAKE
ncbi:MAG: SPOR domain-containing protein [Pseudomonadota bacterium]